MKNRDVSLPDAILVDAGVWGGTEETKEKIDLVSLCNHTLWDKQIMTMSTLSWLLCYLRLSSIMVD